MGCGFFALAAFTGLGAGFAAGFFEDVAAGAFFASGFFAEVAFFPAAGFAFFPEPDAAGFFALCF